MPKPRTGQILKREIRITPYDGVEISTEEWSSVIPFFTKMIVFREGDDSKKLHYHGYLETEYGEVKMRQVIRSLCHCSDQGVNGNSLFFTRQPHDRTWGYIAKHGKCVFRHGESQTTIDDWIRSSKEYLKSKESERKKQQRNRDEELGQIVDQVQKDLKVTPSLRYAEGVVSRILDLCVHEEVRFPARSQMEMFVLRILYPYNPDVVRLYYSRSFQCI